MPIGGGSSAEPVGKFSHHDVLGRDRVAWPPASLDGSYRANGVSFTGDALEVGPEIGGIGVKQLKTV